jgi:hypothetical protein
VCVCVCAKFRNMTKWNWLFVSGKTYNSQIYVRTVSLKWLTLRHRRMDRRDLQIRRRSSVAQRTPYKSVPLTACPSHVVGPDTVSLCTSRNLVSKPGLCVYSLSCVTFQNRVVYKHLGFLPHREHCQSLLQRTAS